MMQPTAAPLGALEAPGAAAAVRSQRSRLTETEDIFALEGLGFQVVQCVSECVHAAAWCC
eukprot:754367-Hanusia_phi.AAC.1